MMYNWNLKFLFLIISVNELSETDLLGNSIIWVCDTCALQMFTELEAGLASFMMDFFNLLMLGIRTYTAVGTSGRVAFNNHTKFILIGMLWTKAVTVTVCEWDLAVMDRTAWKSNGYTIYYDNPYFLAIII